MTMGRVVAIVAVLLVAGAAGWYFSPDAMPPVAEAKSGAETLALTVETASGKHVYQVEVARDSRTQARGLMFRNSMPENHGMLFDFGTDRPLGFWMRNTYISLDIIFFRADGIVHRIAADAVPLSEKNIPSGIPLRYVLELNAGQARKIGLKPGDRISFDGLGKP